MLLGAVGLVTGCDAQPAKQPAAPIEATKPAESGTIGRDQSRLVLESSCGQCHISATGGLPAALAVFDLSEDDWARQLSKTQAADIVRRLKEPQTPSMEQPDGEENTATAGDVATVESYLKRRVGLPTEAARSTPE